MEKALKVLSDIILHMKYARYMPEFKRRETWEEVVDRNMKMHLKKFPQLEVEIRKAYALVFDRKVLPSMRTMQFAGKAIEMNSTRGYNCSYLPVDSLDAFSETMFLLLGGTGVGYSVQTHHIKSLPYLRGPLKAEDDNGRKRRYLIGDSIEGWADAIKVLVESYFYGKKEVEFDYRDIRPKGSLLVTAGGKAPGPQPLKDCIHNISKVLDNALAERGRNCKLMSLEAHDIQCHIADAVLAGGIRRASMISFFNIEDQDMLHAKTGEWYISNPQRARANNSVVLVRHKLKKEDFDRIWKVVQYNGTGEPGIVFTNDKDMLGNPCYEASLKPFTFCNLVTMNVSTVESQEDFEARCWAASFISTLQASYTDFHYLRDIWTTNTEKDALLGVSMTGLASKWFLDNVDLTAGAREVLATNEITAKKIGINKAARTTLVKPDGTSSLLLACSSGIHAWYASYYIRRIRVGKNEAIYQYLSIYNPSILEDDKTLQNTAIISIPVKSPDGAITREESPIDLLSRVKRVHNEWIVPGHRKGSNTHNTSVTISIKPEEWDTVGEWMWENRENYNGISVIPFDNGNYVQPPFEEITKEEYEERIKHIDNIDLSMVFESLDNTNLSGEVACGGGACEIK